MAAVIQPFMKAREYRVLDVFTNYWASYTGARSAKWEQRMQLVLARLDSSQLGDLIDDLRRRRDDLVGEQRRLRRYQIGDVSRQERDVRRTSTRRTTTSTSALNQYVGRVGEYEKYNASAKERYDTRQQEEHKLLAKEEKEKTENTADFYRLMSTSWAAESASERAAVEPHKAGDIYAQYLAGMEGKVSGTSEAAVRNRDAHALALYNAALGQGHSAAAAHIAREYDGFRGAHPSTLLDDRTDTVSEMAKVREDRLSDIGPPVGVNTSRIYDDARRQYRIDHPEEAEEAEATAGRPPGPTETTDPLQSAFDLYGAEQMGVSAQIAALDAQIAALAVAKQAERALGMNTMQAMMNEYWSFAPPSVRTTTEPLIEEVAGYIDPGRFDAYREGVKEHGTPGGLRRAQLRGDVSPYDPIRPTSVGEYASANQGAFVFGYLHDEVQGIERMLSQPGGEAKIVEAYAKVMGLSGQTARIVQLGQKSEPFMSRVTPFAKNIGPLWKSEDSALRRRFMAAGYREATAEDGRVVRQYGDGQITVDGTIMDEPTLADLFDGPIDSNKFTDFNHEREDLPSMDEVLAEVGELRSLAQAEMGGNDVMLGELMSFSLNESMANPDPSARMQDIYATNQIVSQLPRSLVGDRSIQLSQAMELTAAQGDVRRLFEAVDKIIESGQDPDPELFAEYMKEYGSDIRPAAPGEPADVGRGLIERRKEDVFSLEAESPELSQEQQLEDEKALMELEALERARGRITGEAGWPDPRPGSSLVGGLSGDPGLPLSMRDQPTYDLTPEQAALLEGYKSEHRELLPISPGVSREDLMYAMRPEEKARLKELEDLISEYEGMKTEPQEPVETGPLELAETEEGAARFRAFEEQRDQPTPATPAATLLSIPYLTRMSEEGKVEPGRIEELKAAIEGIEFGDPEEAGRSAGVAHQILLEQQEVSQAALDEAQQEYRKALEEHQRRGDRLWSFTHPFNDAELEEKAKIKGYESFAHLQAEMLGESKAQADAAGAKAESLLEPLNAIKSDLLKLDVHASKAGEVSMEGEPPAHLQKQAILGKVKAKNPELVGMPDADLWDALLTEKARLVDAGEPIEGLWAEINP